MRQRHVVEATLSTIGVLLPVLRSQLQKSPTQSSGLRVVAPSRRRPQSLSQPVHCCPSVLSLAFFFPVFLSFPLLSFFLFSSPRAAHSRCACHSILSHMQLVQDSPGPQSSTTMPPRRRRPPTPLRIDTPIHKPDIALVGDSSASNSTLSSAA